MQEKTMLKTNEDLVVEMFMECKPGPPRVGPGWKVDHNGVPFLLPGIGGITLNVGVGDPAFGLAGDHIEPGVSCTANADKPNEFPNNSLQFLSCVGNEAKILTGDAKGETGVVIGHHGGSEHIIVEFAKEVKERMGYDDRIRIRARGQGLALTDYPGIRLFNLSPELLHKMKIKTTDKGTLVIPVTTLVPAACMGSGLGRAHVGAGDYDVMTSDVDTVRQFHLDRMRFGDFVALMDHDNSYGRAYKKGAVSIGIVVHSDCRLAGHGPGIATLMTSPAGLMEPKEDPLANIADLLGIGTRIN
jgi:hypothetical protein